MNISVLMTAYNRRAYIGQAIESVLAQEGADFELIIVDDGSKDGTVDIVRAFARRDPRIVLHLNSENVGRTASLNIALSRARHDLVAIMDDDDVMLPSRLARHAEFMAAHPQVSVAAGWAHLIDENGTAIGQSCPVIDLEKGKALFNPRLFLEIIQPAACFRRRDVLSVGGYMSPMLEDRDLWGRMATAGFQLAIQPEFLMLQRKHDASIMSTKLEQLFHYGDFIDFNVVRRLRGERELTLEQYDERIRSLPLLQRLTIKRKRKARIAFRRATVHYAKRNWIALAGELAIATLLEPLGTLKQVGERLRPKPAVSGSLPQKLDGPLSTFGDGLKRDEPR
jgi:glycosyltransferase involved in cell wall biosynthesis